MTFPPGPPGPPYGPPPPGPPGPTGPPFGPPAGPPYAQPYAPPPPGYPPAAPPPWYPPAPTNRRAKWIIAGVITALALVAVAGAAIWHFTRDSREPKITAPMADLLLSREELFALINPGGEATSTVPDMREDTPDAHIAEPANCTSAVIIGSSTAYPPGTYTDFALRANLIGIGTADQTAVRFESTAKAKAFREQQVATWKKCFGSMVALPYQTLTDPTAYVGAIDTSTDIVTMEVKIGESRMPCQRAMTTVSNVVIEAKTCTTDHPTEGTHKAARDVVEAIVARTR